MEKFYLELPSIKRKKEIIDFINEFAFYNSPTNGCGFLGEISDDYPFENALHDCLNMKDQKFAKKMGRCESKTFLLIRANYDKIVGSIQIRWNLPEEMKKFGGNIGYGIRPTQRKKGYSKIGLYLGLIEIQKMGLTQIQLSSDSANVGSIKTMIALGGIFKETGLDPYDNISTSVYAFDVNKSIRHNKNTYEQFIYVE